MKWRSWSKWPLLGLTATAVVLAAPQDEVQDAAATAAGSKPQQAEPNSPAPAAHGKQALPVGRVELELLNRVKREDATEDKKDKSDKTDVVIVNAFNPTSWYVPPPPPPPPPKPVPTAPPIPFSYLGRYEDPPARIAMLTKGDRVYTVSEGDVIDETYRIDRISDSKVELVYLPLGTNQSISTGAP